MYHELHGLADPEAPTLVLSAGLGGSAAFWAPQLPALVEDYRVLVYDQRGTGRSPSPLPPGYRVADMADELLALLDARGIARCHLVGHALGGLIGLQLALEAPERLDSLVLANAWARPSPHTARCFSVRRQLLQGCGPAAYVEAQALFLYPPDWIATHGERLAADEAHALAQFPPPDNLLRRIEALLAFDIDAELPRIDTPTLLIANRDDMLVPFSQSVHLAQRLPAAQLECLDEGGHASSVTDSPLFNRLLLDHLARQRAARAAA